ncbi:uncharacterized protein LOC128552148 isoform X2 [Mercenaria mercenaria]|nr:uncharacterized protein LOC128552148 isoform X2 [Mercenaria mercenaria]
MNMTGIDNTDLTKMRKSVASRIMLFEHYLTDCCPKCGFVIEDDDKMQCSKCHRWYHFKPYCLADDVADMNDGEEFVCRLCKVDFWPNNQLSVSALKTEEKGIVWTSRQEVMEKLQQSTKLDTDVIVIDQDTWKMDTDVYIEKGLKRKRGLRGLRQKEFLKHPRTSFVYAPLKQQKKTFQPTKSACEDGGDNSSVFKFIIPDYIHQSYSDDDDDDVCIEDGFFINSQTAIHHMTFAVSRLQCIVAVTEKQREEPWLKSHYRFLKGQSNALHGYGFVVFSPPAIETIRYNVKKIFYKNASGHVYTTAGQVEGMKDQKAKDLFAKDVFLAAEYIEQVLVKEALLAVFQSYTGCQYQEADAECLLVVNKSQRKATVDAINLCSKKKEELEKRFL